MVLVVCAGGTICLENPANSLICHHPRWVWFVNLVGKHGIPVFKTAFWMRKHLAPTWKRTWVWSTSSTVNKLDLGPLLPSEKVTQVKTTMRWRDEHGKQRWQGTKDLKGTQLFGLRLRDLSCAAQAIHVAIRPEYDPALSSLCGCGASQIATSGCLVAMCRAHNCCTKVADGATLEDLFETMSYGTDLWDECSDLRDVLVYVRGSQLLRIPLSWRPLLPTSL